MGIDIYRKKETMNRLFAVSDKLYGDLKNSILDEFERITGIFIDEYGTCRLGSQHAGTLVSLLKKKAEERKIDKTAELVQFIQFLEQANKTGIDLELVGD